MGYATPDLEAKWAAQQRGELTRVELPDGGGVAWVKTGAAAHVLEDGRILRMDWPEVNPPKIGHVTIEGPVNDTARNVVAMLRSAALEIQGMYDLSPRARNALIGQLGNVAAQVIGARVVADFDPVPFSPGK